jgi:hypothetical protein
MTAPAAAALTTPAARRALAAIYRALLDHTFSRPGDGLMRQGCYKQAPEQVNRFGQTVIRPPSDRLSTIQ